MIKIRYIFWNIKNKNLLAPIAQLIIENNIDIVALVEANSLDTQSLFNELLLNGQQWKTVQVYPMSDIKLIAKCDIHISVHQEGERYCTYKLYNDNNMYLLNILHLESALYLDESARSSKASSISDVLRKIEETIFKDQEYKTITVGDFNLQPYSQGVAGYYGFNATMSEHKAKKIVRRVDKQEKYFYYNPMWKLMGDKRLVQGTYYNSSDQQGKSIFWYTFDELLIRPYLIDKFNWDFFEIIEKTKKHSFIKNKIIDKAQYSDHLPIKFEIL